MSLTSHTLLVCVQRVGPNQCCGPHWVVFQVLSMHLPSQLEADSDEDYGIEDGSGLPRKGAGSWCGGGGRRWTRVSCACRGVTSEGRSACSRPPQGSQRRRGGPSAPSWARLPVGAARQRPRPCGRNPPAAPTPETQTPSPFLPRPPQP